MAFWIEQITEEERKQRIERARQEAREGLYEFVNRWLAMPNDNTSVEEATKIKLTSKQLETLEYVEAKDVRYMYNPGIQIQGARKDVIKRLLKLGLITFNIRSFFGFFELTDAGRAALESALQKKGK